MCCLPQRLLGNKVCDDSLAAGAAAWRTREGVNEDEVEASDELKRDDSGSCGRDAVSHRIDAFLWMETPFFPTSKGI
jgi:hypothetical protein